MIELAKRLIAWDDKYPKSAVHLPPAQIAEQEIALDDIIMDFREYTKANPEAAA